MESYVCYRFRQGGLRAGAGSRVGALSHPGAYLTLWHRVGSILAGYASLYWPSELACILCVMVWEDRQEGFHDKCIVSSQRGSAQRDSMKSWAGEWAARSHTGRSGSDV